LTDTTDDSDDRGRGRGGFGGGGGDRAHVPETTGVRFRKMVIKLGDEEVSYNHYVSVVAKLTGQDFDPIEDPPRLAKVLMRSWKEGCLGVFDGFRIG
jgi:nuclear cap-binding protein subunit 1